MQTILVIDDDAMNLRMAEFILNKNGYAVYKAASGQEALEFIETEQKGCIYFHNVITYHLFGG